MGDEVAGHFEKSMKDAVGGEVDPLDDPNFDPVAYINRMFPDEASLAHIDPFISKVKTNIRKLDAQIVHAIREQSKSGTRAKQDLQNAENAIKELFAKLKEIKSRSEESEIMVDEICRDIKALDYGKKHLTTTITTLKRLHMLVTAADQLKVMARNKQYREAANLLEATKQLSTNFSAFRKIPKIAELQDHIEDLESGLRAQVFEDLKTHINTPRESLEISLADACRLVEALGPEAREEVVEWYTNLQFAAYRNAFQPYGEAGSLDKTERRYAWMRRLLRQYDEDHSNIFPAAWRVDEHLCSTFERHTSKHMTEILENHKNNMDVSVFMHVLQKTAEFEKELQQRFAESGGESKGMAPRDDLEDGEDAEAGNADLSSVEGIKAKYRQMRAKKDKPDKPPDEAPKAAAPEGRKWNTVSQTFEPYMDLYVRLEDKNMQEMLQRLVDEESWQATEGQAKVLQSSTNLFLYIKRILRRCSSYTRGKKMIDLHTVFRKTLTSYANQLQSHMPAAQNANMAGVQLTETELKKVCHIINTAQYCYDTALQLCESVQRLVSSELSEQIVIEEEQDAFHNVSTKGVKVLVAHVSSHLENAYAMMLRLNWAQVQDVGDSSAFVTEIGNVLADRVPIIVESLNPTFLRFFCDKFVAAFAQRYVANIFKCKRISDMGCQQLLLDTQTLQLMLVKLPVMGMDGDPPPNPPSSFKAFVDKEMGKVDAIVKVAGTPTESTLSAFLALMPEGTNYEFQKVLELKGAKKSDMTTLMAQLSAKRNEPRSKVVP